MPLQALAFALLAIYPEAGAGESRMAATMPLEELSRRHRDHSAKLHEPGRTQSLFRSWLEDLPVSAPFLIASK
jgi:hypothetical protein